MACCDQGHPTREQVALWIVLQGLALEHDDSPYVRLDSGRRIPLYIRGDARDWPSACAGFFKGLEQAGALNGRSAQNMMRDASRGGSGQCVCGDEGLRMLRALCLSIGVEPDDG